jgi:uncharacterized protein YbjT (DUF2867 family)
MNIIVFGATGQTGRAVIAKLLEAGHKVTAFVRDASRLTAAPNLKIVQGDAMQSADVERAVPGHDAVVVTLGNSQNPFLLAPAARLRPIFAKWARGTSSRLSGRRRR